MPKNNFILRRPFPYVYRRYSLFLILINFCIFGIRFLYPNVAEYVHYYGAMNPIMVEGFSDEVLKTIIKYNKGIEVNTAGLKYGLPFAHPHSKLLKRYLELGGTTITIGSDAHKPEHLAYDFDKVADILKESGITSYNIFENRKIVETVKL